jgi:hypothetical protein
MAGGFAVLGMLPDPFDIGPERIAELLDAVREQSCIVEEDEVEACECFRHERVIHAPDDDRREALVERRRKRDLLGADLGGHRVGTEQENDGVSLGNQSLDALPPILEGVDLGAVDQRLEPALIQSGLQPIRESHVLARIGDKDLGFGLGCFATAIRGH